MKANYSNVVTKYATINQASERYKLGRTKLMEIARKEECLRYFGRAPRIDVPKLDRALENY